MKPIPITITALVLLSLAMHGSPGSRAEPPRLLYLAKNRELERPEPPKTPLEYVKRDTWHESMRASLEATLGAASFGLWPNRTA